MSGMISTPKVFTCMQDFQDHRTLQRAIAAFSRQGQQKVSLQAGPEDAGVQDGGELHPRLRCYRHRQTVLRARRTGPLGTVESSEESPWGNLTRGGEMFYREGSLRVQPADEELIGSSNSGLLLRTSLASGPTSWTSQVAATAKAPSIPHGLHEPGSTSLLRLLRVEPVLDL